MTEQHFLYLLDGFKQRTLSREELVLFLDAAAESQFESLLGDQLLNDISSYKNSISEDPAYQEIIWESLNNKRSLSPVRPSSRIHFLHRWWAAASIILLLGIGAYFWTTNKKNTYQPAVAGQTVDIAPGKEGAILTLADGSQVVLDSLGNGLVAHQPGGQAMLQNGQLVYEVESGAIHAEATPPHNTMTTPKGRQFSLTLPDGTRVWLNAASSLRYPTVFSGKERRVEITGEAYFEVISDKKKPFLVNINNEAQVEVLGTQFNVNAYGDEASISTTLLAGSVKMVQVGQQTPSGMGTADAVILQPGQQAQLMLVSQQTQQGKSGAIKVINDVDIDKVMAWKNGLIYFDGMTFDAIMRQLERWYDIKVLYENNTIPNKKLAGKMTRGVSLHDLLEYLGNLGVHYKLNDRTLTVLP